MDESSQPQRQPAHQGHHAGSILLPHRPASETAAAVNNNAPFSHAHHHNHHRSNGFKAPRNQTGESSSITSSSADHRATNHNRSADLLGQQQQQQPPLFQRIVTEEVQGIKTLKKVVEDQSQQLVKKERTHKDLEARLEAETRKRQLLENKIEDREREWLTRLKVVEDDRDQWKRAVEEEQKKNKNLSEQLCRNGKDIHRMLQRKVRLNSECFLSIISHGIYEFLVVRRRKETSRPSTSRQAALVWWLQSRPKKLIACTERLEPA